MFLNGRISGNFNSNIITAIGRYLFVRRLTTHETAAALRPFYFAVHPDFFGRHPKERATNEDSLKQIGQYLESLQKFRQAKPIDVTFYVRETQAERDIEAGVRPVSVHLIDHNNVRSAVSTILKSCDLSLDYIDSVPPQSRGFDRPIKWHHTYYSYTGKLDPDWEFNRPKPKPKVTLQSWLSENAQKVTDNFKFNQPIREENEKYISELCADFNLNSIQWCSDWGYRNFRGCLIGFSRLVKENSHKLSHLEGRSIIFCDRTGVSLYGNVLLSAGDVPTHWLNMLLNVSKHESTLAGLPSLEADLSRMLHGIQIVRRPDQGVVMATEYDKQLRALMGSLRRCWKAKRDILGGSLQHLQLVVETASGPLAVSTAGQFLVPSSCPGSLLVEFIVNNHHQAHSILLDQAKKATKVEAILSETQTKLKLKTLERDSSLSLDRVYTCCEKLLEKADGDLGELLHDSRLNITFSLSVTDDGKILIPWNWFEM